MYWTTLVHKFSTTFTYKDFIDSFLYPIMNMLTSKTQPRIGPEIKRVMQLAKKSKVGYWYLYQNHTEIRIYGCELAPYKLPKYLPMKIFALEYFRKIISFDEIYFLAYMKKTQFKVKNQMGPFNCNNREAGPEANKLLQQMKVINNFMWHYDPHGVINNLRLKVKLGAYIHHPRFDIEQFANQDEWVENTLTDMDNTVVDVENTLIDLERQFDHNYFLQVLEQGEPMKIPLVIQTPANEEKNSKRNKEEAYSSAMETTDELFEPSKRPKLNPVSE